MAAKLLLASEKPLKPLTAMTPLFLPYRTKKAPAWPFAQLVGLALNKVWEVQLIQDVYQDISETARKLRWHVKSVRAVRYCGTALQGWCCWLSN